MPRSSARRLVARACCYLVSHALSAEQHTLFSRRSRQAAYTHRTLVHFLQWLTDREHELLFTGSLEATPAQPAGALTSCLPMWGLTRCSSRCTAHVPHLGSVFEVARKVPQVLQRRGQLAQQDEDQHALRRAAHVRGRESEMVSIYVDTKELLVIGKGYQYDR